MLERGRMKFANERSIIAVEGMLPTNSVGRVLRADAPLSDLAAVRHLLSEPYMD